MNTLILTLTLLLSIGTAKLTQASLRAPDDEDLSGLELQDDGDCAVGCTEEYLADGVCDPMCNYKACNWDGGDCGSDHNQTTCNDACDADMLGNGECDEVCNTQGCGYDNGDCGQKSFVASHPGSSFLELDTEAKAMTAQSTPSLNGAWCGRTWKWTIHNFNGDTSNVSQIKTVEPGQSCNLDVSVSDVTFHNPTGNYCPGCIVQLYFGMRDVFSKGVIEYGLSYWN